MTIINRKTKEILEYNGRTEKRLYIRVTESDIYFTSAICRLCGISTGRYINFLNDGKSWRFVVTDDPDGFKLTPIISKNAFEITSSGLCNMILKSFDTKGQKKFSVHQTEATIDGRPVFAMSIENVSTVKM